MGKVHFPWCRYVGRFVWLCKYEWLLVVACIAFDVFWAIKYRLKRRHPFLALQAGRVLDRLFLLVHTCGRYGEPTYGLRRLAPITTDEILDLHQMSTEEIWSTLRATS